VKRGRNDLRTERDGATSSPERYDMIGAEMATGSDLGAERASNHSRRGFRVTALLDGPPCLLTRYADGRLRVVFGDVVCVDDAKLCNEVVRSRAVSRTVPEQVIDAGRASSAVVRGT